MRVVRTRRVRVTVTGIEALVYRLKLEKFTGKLVLNFSQGGLNEGTLEDSTPLPIDTDKEMKHEMAGRI
jgi:hypothetical protein